MTHKDDLKCAGCPERLETTCDHRCFVPPERDVAGDIVRAINAGSLSEEAMQSMSLSLLSRIR